jgi:hypothetical protein
VREYHSEVAIFLSVLQDICLARAQVDAAFERSALSTILQNRTSSQLLPLKVKGIEFDIHLQRVSTLIKKTLFNHDFLVHLIGQTEPNSRPVDRFHRDSTFIRLKSKSTAVI